VEVARRARRRAPIRLAAWAVAVAVILAGAVAALLSHPDPLFRYRAALGRLELMSDRDFSAAAGAAVLADVEARLAASALNRTGATHLVAIANRPWRRRLVFLWNGRARGVSYYPLTDNAFIGPSDIEGNRVFGPSGLPAQPPRTLAYFIAHEIAHGLAGERVGAVAYFRLPRWIREGVADHVAFGSVDDTDELLSAWKAGDARLDPERSGQYARYRLLAGFMLHRKGWSVDQLLHSDMPQAEAERLLLAGAGPEPP
jgi:hypothetical protein